MSGRYETIVEIGEKKLSAIIRTDDEEQARRAMNAAVAGGFRMVEFTLTTPGALGLIEEFGKKTLPGGESLLVGAGTVLSRKDAREAVTAGANVLVAGSALFRDPAGLEHAVAELRAGAERAQSA